MRLAIPTLILAIILVLGWRVCSGGEQDHLRLTEEDLPVELREGYDATRGETHETAVAGGGGLESLPGQDATATPDDDGETAGYAVADGVEFASSAAGDREADAEAQASVQLVEKPAESAPLAIDVPHLPSVSASSSADSAEAGDTGDSEGRIYVVQPGDWMMKIARDQYGDASAARKIARRNRLNDVDQLKPGQKLILP
jgi:nucleoid-associated protein YgaU